MITTHVGQALDGVRQLPDDSVDLVATSPPFLALRNYNDLPDQWGSEDTPAEFLQNLLDLTTELRRVLTPGGSIAIELGDTYSGSGGAGGDYKETGLRAGQEKFTGSGTRKKRRARRRDEVEGIIPIDNRPGPGQRDSIDGWPLAKSLCGTPSLFAYSLAYGWNLLDPAAGMFPKWRIRNLICWARRNPMPGALADKYRPAVSYITVATVATDRWFDLDAVRHDNPRASERHRVTEKMNGQAVAGMRPPLNNDTIDQNPRGAPPHDYWEDEYDGDVAWLINTLGSSLPHYAMWPAALAERLVLSMCPAAVCRICSEPRRRLTTTEQHPTRRTNGRKHGGSGTQAENFDRRTEALVSTVGWTDCGCAGSGPLKGMSPDDHYRPGVVLDPFAGTGTTLAAADLHGRDAIGIDLDPRHEQIHQIRYDEVKQNLFGIKPPIAGQLEMGLA